MTTTPTRPSHKNQWQGAQEYTKQKQDRAQGGARTVLIVLATQKAKLLIVLGSRLFTCYFKNAMLFYGRLFKDLSLPKLPVGLVFKC
jgi:hypothetical protein